MSQDPLYERAGFGHAEPAACPKCGSEIQGTCDHKWHYDRVAPERMTQATVPDTPSTGQPE